MKWFKQQSPSEWLAIRMSQQNLVVAQVQKRTDKMPMVKLAQIEDMALDSDKFKAFVKRFKLDKTSCSYVLNVNDYQCLQIEKPMVPKEEVKQAARWKIKDLLDYPVEEATIDVLEIPQDATQNRQANAYVIAAKNQLIGEISNQLIDRKVHLSAIDTALTAQRNIAALFEQDNRALAMLSISHLGGLLTFTAGQELYHSRFIELEDEGTFANLERVALELQRSLDHFDRQFPHLTVNQLLLAPFEEQATFLDYLKTALYIPVKGFQLNDAFEFDAAIAMPNLRAQASLLPVLGASLREEGYA
jgi:MSHA biogenesis protein MshI